MSIKIEGVGSKENVFSDSETGMPLWNGVSLLNLVYPVGSIYLSSNSTNPGTLFGGTWTQIKDRFILTAGNSYTVNSTGGAATVTLSVSNMPSHSHSFTPSGTVASHTHTGPSHTHSFTPSGTVGKHTHSFTPSGTVESHSHSLNNHKHSFSGNTGNMSANSSGTADLMGAELLHSTASGNMSVAVGKAGWGGGHIGDLPENVLLTINVQHTHSISGTTGEATGNTGSTDPKFTGTEGTTGETAPSFSGTAGTTGAAGTGNTGSTAPSFTGTAGTTGANGSGTAHNNMPPYVVKYCWERTA